MRFLLTHPRYPNIAVMSAGIEVSLCAQDSKNEDGKSIEYDPANKD